MGKIKTINVSDKISKYEAEQISEMVLNALINFGVEVGEDPEFSWDLEAEVWIEGGKVDE
tara:strand:- start:14701 stop:14880 length:180 start_codon:yes stop_codon:yes gene_type:complete